MGPHQRFLLAQQLAHSAFREDAVARVSEAIAARLQPYAEAIARLDTIPGVGRRIAETLVAQVGTDMSRFPTAAHLASWAGICPGNHARAGKRLSGRTRRGSPWLRAALVEAGHAAGHSKRTDLDAPYRRSCCGAARRARSSPSATPSWSSPPSCSRPGRATRSSVRSISPNDTEGLSCWSVIPVARAARWCRGVSRFDVQPLRPRDRVPCSAEA